MTWTTDASGWARFSDDRSPWRVRTAPARPESGLLFYRSDAREPSEDALGLPRLLPPGDQPFPPLAESYSRGNDLIANLPQPVTSPPRGSQPTGPEFGLELCHRVVRSTPELMVIETIVAVQTSLLDSHPTVDLACDGLGRSVPDLAAALGDSRDWLIHSHVDADRRTTAPPSATCFPGSGDTDTTVVLLPPSDRAAAADQSPPGSVRYRLLAEFLEKGVIRKARFWTVRSLAPPSDRSIAELYAQLLHIPLPLTP